MRPAIIKEILHYDILFSLDKEGSLDELTFQGGTSLRLCYGASRYSEDLDFVDGKDFASAKLIAMKECIEKYIGEHYGFVITVKEPKEMSKILEYEGIRSTNGKSRSPLHLSKGMCRNKKSRLKLQIFQPIHVSHAHYYKIMTFYQMDIAIPSF